MADLYGPGQMRRETAANWASSNPTMLAGEAGIVTDALPFAMKVGNGATAFNALGFGPSKIGFGTLNVSNYGFVLGGYGYGAGTVGASAAGAVAQGYVNGAGSISASASGAFARGYAYDSGTIAASSQGGTAWGWAGGTGSSISAQSNPGAHAHGWVYNGATIIASGYGSHANGSASDGGDILAAGLGSFATGRVDNSGTISSSGIGSFAGGQVVGSNYEISTSYSGAFVWGSATTGDIIATAVGAVQFAPGTNNVANSLAVGADLRLHADGAPGTPRNGDQWVASGYVYIRSNGASVKIT